MHPNRPRHIGSRYLNEESVASSGTFFATSKTSYVFGAGEPHIVSVNGQLATCTMQIFSGVHLDAASHGVFSLEIQAAFTGQPSGTPNIFSLNIADLPGFSAGFALGSLYSSTSLTVVSSSVSPQKGLLSFASPTVVTFTLPNNPSVLETNWKFTFIQ